MVTQQTTAKATNVRVDSRPRKRRAPAHVRQQRMLAYAMVAPAVILIAIFVFIPAVKTIRYSFYRWDGYAPNMEYVGLRMYRQAIDGLGFPEAVRHSLIWGVVALIVPPGIGLAAAALVEDSAIRAKGLFRFGFFLPYFFSMAVAGAIFTRIYDPSYGLINRSLDALGFSIQPQWLGDGSLAIWAAIGVFVWHETAFCFIVFASAIQQVDRELYGAARVDGANGFQVFRDVTVPALRSIITFIMSVMLIGGLTPFAVIFALTTPGIGGPYYATEVLPTLIFKKGLSGTNIGQASALGVMLLVVVLTVTLSFLWLRGRLVKGD